MWGNIRRLDAATSLRDKKCSHLSSGAPPKEDAAKRNVTACGFTRATGACPIQRQLPSQLLRQRRWFHFTRCMSYSSAAFSVRRWSTALAGIVPFTEGRVLPRAPCLAVSGARQSCRPPIVGPFLFARLSYRSW